MKKETLLKLEQALHSISLALLELESRASLFGIAAVRKARVSLDAATGALKQEQEPEPPKEPTPAVTP